MDFNQQLSAFREWAFHFDGPSQKWMWSAIAILVGYGLGSIVSRLLRFLARKLAGLAKHKEGDDQLKTADHVMIDILGALIRAENTRGVATNRIVLAGFSQGGAMALHLATRHPEKFAGVIALSCYLPLAREFATDRSAANFTTPIYMAHGTQDPVVPIALGEESRRILEGTGFRVEWHAYPMPHSLCEQEVADIRDYLARALPRDPT